MTPPGIMHLIDHLQVGGAEQMAVSLANLLPRDRYTPHLCTTRHEGPLAAEIEAHVGRLRLGRTRRFDPSALSRLVSYIREHDVRILHAHSTALFAAYAASFFHPYPAIIWHDHFGRDLSLRRSWMYRLPARRAAAVIAVSGPLAEWSRDALGVDATRIRLVRNFAAARGVSAAAPLLPGVAAMRVACVANWREQKDHPTLLHAFDLVRRSLPEAQLLLIGTEDPGPYGDQVRAEITRRGLERSVTRMGCRDDVPAILRQCAVGVLSSRSEGLPLALLDYGSAGIAAVATDVGQCPEVLDHGGAGTLVPPGSPAALADALVRLLRDEGARVTAARALHDRVAHQFSPEAALEELGLVYDRVVLGRAAPVPAMATAAQ